MKLSLLSTLILGMSGMASAQAPSITVQDAIVRLGMTQSEVTAEFDKHPGLFLLKDGMVANQEQDNKNLRLYATVKFSKGRLAYVEKYWRNENAPDSGLAVMNALFGATSSVVGDGRVCKVKTWTETQTAQDYKETMISCELSNATRSIHAFIKTFHYEHDIHSVQVNEVLEIRAK